MANYNLYDDINESELLSLSETLTSDISTNQSALTSFSESLTEDMWKASAKETLKTGYTKIGEVFTELTSEIEKVQKACNAITLYKTARTQALKYQEQIEAKENNVDENGTIIDQVGLAVLKGLKTACEQVMEKSEAEVNGICGG